MEKPGNGAVLMRDPYWDAARAERQKSGERYPDWIFDFISIHPSPFKPTFGFCSPMMLVNERTGERPTFENWEFPTMREAITSARRIARRHKTFILVCPAY